VVCISTSSIYTKTHSDDAAERKLIGSIKASEHRLTDLCRDRNLPLVLLHPTLVYGCGLDENISRVARFIRRFGFFPVAGKASGLRQPVHAADLAQIAVDLVCVADLSGFSSPVCGGSVLSYRRMVELVFASQDMQPRLISIPPGLLSLMLRALSCLPVLDGAHSGFVLRQNLDQVFDDAVLRDGFGYKPRVFEPSSADFHVPEYARKLQLP
jgi:nucleoside-diphosphate-sugar epimerase